MGEFSKDLVTRLVRKKPGVGMRSANAFNKIFGDGTLPR